MSKKRSQRKIDRIDYKELDRTGKRVLKETKRLEEVSIKLDNIMSREQLVSDEAKLCLKIERFVKDNEIGLFFDVAEIDEALSIFTPMIENFEHYHVELRQQLDEQEYKDLYGDSFAKTCDKMGDWTKKLKKVRFEMRKDEVDRQDKVRREEIEREAQVRKAREEHDLKDRQALDARLAAEKAAREEEVRSEKQRKAQKIEVRKKKLAREEKFARDRIALELDSIKNRHCVFAEDYDKNISDIKDLMRSYSDIFQKIDEVFEDESGDVFGDTYHDQITTMNALVQEYAHRAQRKRLSDAAEKQAIEEQANERELAAKEREDELKAQTFQSIYGNIRERAYDLQSKYTIDVNTLTDEQLLEKSKELHSLDKSFDDLLDWMTELVKSKPLEDPNSDDILRKSESAMRKLKNLKIEFRQDVLVQISASGIDF